MASSAVARAVRSARCGSKLAVSPSGIGNTVRKPWITSAANSSGIFRREPSIAAFWVSRAAWAPTPLNSAPIRPALTSASRVWALRILTSGFMSAIGGRIMSAKHDSWPAFSSIVI